VKREQLRNVCEPDQPIRHCHWKKRELDLQGKTRKELLENGKGAGQRELVGGKKTESRRNGSQLSRGALIQKTQNRAANKQQQKKKKEETTYCA